MRVIKINTLLQIYYRANIKYINNAWQEIYMVEF